MIVNDIPVMNGRKNILFGDYCKIAMESYYKAYHFYKMIDGAGYSFCNTAEVKEMDRAVISTVIFSAMSLESFFNNYIAAYCGDERFYGVYDSLSPVNKFCLITEFIWRRKVDKSKAYYGGLVNLFRLRNNYVHNKSEKDKIQENICEEQLVVEQNELENEDFSDKMPPNYKKIIKDSIREALEALKTIREVARFFDQNDPNAHAMVFLFGEYNFICASSYEEKPMELVFRQLGIKKNLK